MNAYAVIHPGLEEVVAAELSGLGVSGEVQPGGVRFSADLPTIARLVRTMRTPSQVLVELASGTARSSEALGGLVRKIAWKDWLNPLAEVKVEVSSKTSALRFKENITRSVFGLIREARKGPYIPDRVQRPRHVQVVQVRIVDDKATFSIDAGGDLLHRRGWRTESGKAPIRENLGACLLALAEWDGTDAFYDPFCGSGTLVIEAALLAQGRAPFAGRTFACDEWPALATRSRLAPPPKVPRLNLPIVGSDHHAPSLEAARNNAKRAGTPVDFRLVEVADIEPPAVVGTIVSNMPYGERLGNRVEAVYGAFGHVLRERFQSWRVLFLTTDRRLAERVDRRVERVTQFKNGGIGVGVWSFLP